MKPKVSGVAFSVRGPGMVLVVVRAGRLREVPGSLFSVVPQLSSAQLRAL